MSIFMTVEKRIYRPLLSISRADGHKHKYEMGRWKFSVCPFFILGVKINPRFYRG